MQEIEIIKSLLPKISQLREKPLRAKALIGLDGYIDKIQKAVQKRENTKVDYFTTIPEFANKIHQAANKSAQIEMVNHTIKLGGNAPIMSNALGNLGVKNYCVGTLGANFIEPVFQEMNKHCELISLGAPALSNALEFEDGKLILSELSTFQELNWEKVKVILSIQKMLELFAECALVALVDWCNLPHCTNIWQGILKDILPKLEKPRTFFFDLTDLSKKSDEAIGEVLKTISAYKQFGEVILGLNENEARQLYQALSRINTQNPSESTQLIDLGQSIFDQLNVSYLLIHPIERCLLFSQNQVIELKGKVVQSPKISTGGGDNLNAGFCLGKMAGFTLEECIILGMATSGSYVAEGKSPNLVNLENYLADW